MSRQKVFRRTSLFQLLSLLLTASFVLLFGISANAAQITLEWDPNTETDIAGYKVYYGTAPRTYGSPVDVGNEIRYSVTGLEEGQTYFFAATAYDAAGNESDYSVEVSETISFSNQPPVASDEGFSTSENIQINGTLSAIDADGDTLLYTIVSNGSRGLATLTNTSAGNFIYVPNVDATGTDTFTFKVNDGKTDSNTATVTININAVTIGENPKNLVWDPVMEENIAGYLVYYGIASRAYGEPVDVGNQTIYSLDGFETGPTYYFAVKSYNTDGVESNYSEEVVWLSAGSTPLANQSPVANNGSLITSEDAAISSILTASDADGDVLNYIIVSNGSKGTVTLKDTLTGAFTYSPIANATGTDSFTFKVNDGKADSNTATVMLNINSVNDAPTISGTPAISVTEGTAYNFIPTANDIDEGDTLNFSIVNKPAWAIFDTSTGMLSGTPGKSDSGTVEGIVISVTDNNGAKASLSSFDLTVENLVLPGDVDGSGTIDLVDLHLVQEILSGGTPEKNIYQEADVDGDGKIGLAEMWYILFHTASQEAPESSPNVIQ